MIRALAVFVPTLLFIFVRPGRIKEVWFAAAGALLAWLLGLVSPDDAISLLRETGDVLLFLAGMLVVAYVTDRAGVFERLALWTARAARGRGRLLFAGVYLIGVLVTVWLSLDTTAVILAPIVFSLARALDIPPLPFVFATTYVANTASLFLPVSNLTNLIVLGRLSIPFWEYARVMFLPGLLAVVVNLLLLFWLFRASIPKAYDVRRAERFEYGVVAAGGEGVGHGVYGGAAADVSLPAEEPATKSRECVAVTVAGLLAVLAGLAGAPFWGIGLWVPACAGAAALAAYHMIRAGLKPRALAKDISWDLLPFVFSLFLLLRGVARAGLSQWAAGLVAAWASGQSYGELLAVAAATALGSNLINNLPMVLVAVESLAAPIEAGALHRASLYAALIGTNLGPNLTVIGSLATMLSLSLISKKGLEVPGLTYLKIGLITVPALLAAAVLGLWLSL